MKDVDGLLGGRLLLASFVARHILLKSDGRFVRRGYVCVCRGGRYDMGWVETTEMVLVGIEGLAGCDVRCASGSVASKNQARVGLR